LVIPNLGAGCQLAVAEVGSAVTVSEARRSVEAISPIHPSHAFQGPEGRQRIAGGVSHRNRIPNAPNPGRGGTPFPAQHFQKMIRIPWRSEDRPCRGLSENGRGRGLTPPRLFAAGPPGLKLVRPRNTTLHTSVQGRM
jgi:hypothetical protein